MCVVVVVCCCCPCSAAFLFVFCGEWGRREGGRTFYLSPGMFFGQHIDMPKEERGYVCVCIYGELLFRRGKRAGWKMLLTVLFRPAASPPPCLLLFSYPFSPYAAEPRTCANTTTPPTTSGPLFSLFFTSLHNFADVASDLFLLFWPLLLLLLFLGRPCRFFCLVVLLLISPDG